MTQRVAFAVGVDPGVEGAVAVLDREGGVVQLANIPTTGLTGPEAFDLAEIAGLLDLQLVRGVAVVAIERGQPNPKERGGARTAFARGVWEGWEWMLVGMQVAGHKRVRRLRPRPQQWQPEMLQGTPKGDTSARALVAAQRLWPSVDLRRTERSKKLDHNRADALLIAEWARRQLVGKGDGEAALRA